MLTFTTHRTIPVESFGGEEEPIFLPPGEYQPTELCIKKKVWWLVSLDCHEFMVGLPAEDWRLLAGQRFLTIKKGEV